MVLTMCSRIFHIVLMGGNNKRSTSIIGFLDISATPCDRYFSYFGRLFLMTARNTIELTDQLIKSVFTRNCVRNCIKDARNS